MPFGIRGDAVVSAVAGRVLVDDDTLAVVASPVGSAVLIVATTVTAVSETMLLAREAGLDRSTLLEVLLAGLAGS
ncbi:hypothetical protein ACFDTO_04520 [Microbacteriaceae bacterium 4G12]